jgi:CubicO group peptidase (beta-lactamase class C family)
VKPFPGHPLRAALGLVLIAAALSWPPPVRAAGSPAGLDSVKRYVDGLAAFGFVGQVAVAAGDSVILERASGWADPDGHPVGPDTRFAVGSITKSFTGALVVRLARRGIVSLDDSLPRFFARTPAGKRGVTLRHLLTHTSGLPMDVESIEESDSRDRIVEKILAEPLRSRPGAAFTYSNAGFQLLAAIVERATGRAFADLVRDELLTPCGMTSSGTGAAAARSTHDVADGRNEWKILGSLRAWRQRWAGTGAGDLVSTARDLWRWTRALQGAGPLTRGELDTLLARRVRLRSDFFYGFGLYLVPADTGPDLVSIGGDVPGFHAAAWAQQDEPHRVIVVVMSGERLGRSLLVHAVQRRLWRLLDGQPITMPPEAAIWPPDRLSALAGEWRLAGGGRLELDRDGNGLRLGLAGAGAMNLLFGADSSGSREWLDTRADQLLRAAATPPDTALTALLHPVERAAWEGSLRSGVSACVRKVGAPLEVRIDGTIPLPWLAHGMRTYARLRGPRGECDASLAWLDGGLLDVSFGEGRPQPVILPVSPILEGGLAAWDLFDGRTLKLEPFSDGRGPGLLLSGPGGRDVARRAGGNP